MSLPIEFHPAVRDETHDGYRWYEARRPGLGADFLDEVERVLGSIAVSPASHGFADGDVREAILSRFPYAIYYRELTDRVRVLSVFHTSRDPAAWQSRI